MQGGSPNPHSLASVLAELGLTEEETCVVLARQRMAAVSHRALATLSNAARVLIPERRRSYGDLQGTAQLLSLRELAALSSGAVIESLELWLLLSDPDYKGRAKTAAARAADNSKKAADAKKHSTAEATDARTAADKANDLAVRAIVSWLDGDISADDAADIIDEADAASQAAGEAETADEAAGNAANSAKAHAAGAADSAKQGDPFQAEDYERETKINAAKAAEAAKDATRDRISAEQHAIEAEEKFKEALRK